MMCFGTLRRCGDARLPFCQRDCQIIVTVGLRCAGRGGWGGGHKKVATNSICKFARNL